MSKENKTKLLIKILVGAAWIDGVIQAEEREYLKKVVTENHLENDPEIKSLLSEIKPINAQECYQWLEDYLGNSPKTEDYQKLLEAISALVYSDGDIDIQEAKLLSRLQDLEPNGDNKSIPKQILQSIKKIYQKAIAT
ncbi:TerB family tellurite resistance protein [Cyanobacterium aponinum]|uniref:Co-chaperone DjlA N-terminal domain-containing protein n=2 Tax=Cyanobacterium aponinum TaxID=379064 RepID=K9ZAG1_CYAAP|nr:TerB family tellurite resistance protein [Cyanobacterium aponinum]AFZ55373.1 hypothetical protein Cyan10605_3329 [Cyanobacterium aponinum PCC 10605]MTF40254.1 TerB family tellurite resistance protein [Cyanobacterium aponinum 0216]